MSPLVETKARAGKTGGRRSAARVPRFSLYGERGGPANVLLHIEDVRSRSSLYRWEIEPHVHAALYQIIYVVDGPARISLDDAQATHTGPIAVIAPPGVVHAFRFAPNTDGFVLTLSARWLSDVKLDELGAASSELFAMPRVLAIDATDAANGVDALFRECRAEFARPSGAHSPAVGWLARAILWRLARLCAHEDRQAPAARHHQVFDDYRALIERRYLDHWSLTRYARELEVSVERLNRLCKRLAGVGAYELVQDRLIHEACRRLIYIAAPVANLARELGFADAAYFCRFFKRRTGLTPSAYRKRHSP